MPPSVIAAIDALVAERPNFHGWGDVPVNWQAGDGLLRWLAAQLDGGSTTLETGCGYSTVVFAAAGVEHTVVSPVPQEHERVQAWCADHDIDCSRIRFVAEPSTRWLPGHTDELGALDLVLIDGAHGYPVPALDWYFTAGALAVGGLLVVDDVSIPACGELAAFLSLEAGRWASLTTLDDARVFRKESEHVLIDEPWSSQPWNARRATGDRSLDRAKAKVKALIGR
jgi:predicted O-methyltransferase YrrM